MLRGLLLTRTHAMTFPKVQTLVSSQTGLANGLGGFDPIRAMLKKL